ncbi:histidine-type phosphatase [Streptomyces sp. NPDC001817]|uniref:histidine-type phosphatase n=1 Tax=Streptomyces sp. NPDC001817 TaxID=3154398 RepID=UPI00331E8912
MRGHETSHARPRPRRPAAHRAARARTYQRPPAGYTPVFTENVSRHGSRAATGGEDGDLVLALWDKAQAEDQLTEKGEEFGPAVRALTAAMQQVGYGNLSGRGRQEMRDTATRMEQRLPTLFARIADEGEKIDVVSSGQGRAVDSANEYTGALAAADPALKPLIGPIRTDEDLLYFHKAAGGAAYRDYIANDQRLKDTLNAITDQPRTHEAARSVLRRIFKEPFADAITDQVDFFQQAEAKRAGTSDLGAELRFTHAEEIIPLAALMGLPGSTEPATPGEPYTYADNPWRGASVAPLGADIQWDVYEKDGRYLVRMLYNEKETPFRAGCRPIAEDSAFYDLDELERCFGRA